MYRVQISLIFHLTGEGWKFSRGKLNRKGIAKWIASNPIALEYFWHVT